MIKYIKSVFWRVAKRLSYIEDALCLQVKLTEDLRYKYTVQLSHHAHQNVLVQHRMLLALLITYLLTYSMEQSPSLEANRVCS